MTGTKTDSRTERFDLGAGELTQSLPDALLSAETRGTTVEGLPPDALLFEFCDENGVPCATPALRRDYDAPHPAVSGSRAEQLETVHTARPPLKSSGISL